MCVVAFTCLELWKVLCSESLYRRRNDLAAMQKRSLVTGEVPLFFDDTPYKRPVSIVRTCVLQFGFVDLSPADSFHEAETSASAWIPMTSSPKSIDSRQDRKYIMR